MKGLLRFLSPYRKEFIIGPFFKLVEAILELLLPTVMALVINNGVTPRDPGYVLRMGLLMLGMAILGFCCSLVCQYCAARASQGFGTDLRNAFFSHALGFSHAELDRFGTGSLTTRLTNDINQLQVAVAMLIRLVVRAPFICVGAIVMAMILNPRLSLVLLCATPLFVAILYFVISRTSPLYRLGQKKLDRLSRTVGERLSGARVIRAFTREAHEEGRFDEANEDLAANSNRAARVSALLSPATGFIMNMAIVVILWAGGREVDTGSFSRGEIVAYINYVTQVLLALIVVSNLVILFTRAYAAAGRVAEVLGTEPSIKEPQHPALDAPRNAPSPNAPILEFRNVAFAYPGAANPSLEGISLSLARGESLGVIGATGSGKTSLVNLIGRFQDASSGSVLFEGRDVREWELSALRARVAYVPQESVLMTGTVADNLRMGRADASEGELEEACAIAQASGFVRDLPQGLSAPVSRGGRNFSGGQRQRLAIARALAAGPELLILDDSFSALDLLTEARLRAALRERRPSLSAIIISQRVASISGCDRIILMDDGRIVAEGRHGDLVADSPLYRHICLSQEFGTAGRGGRP
jgi:ATP-binding cassette subfamily B protein